MKQQKIKWTTEAIEHISLTFRTLNLIAFTTFASMGMIIILKTMALFYPTMAYLLTSLIAFIGEYMFVTIISLCILLIIDYMPQQLPNQITKRYGQIFRWFEMNIYNFNKFVKGYGLLALVMIFINVIWCIGLLK